MRADQLIMTVPRTTQLGKRLTAMRKRLGLTQAEAAAKVHVSLRAWISWELGQQRNPSPKSLLLIDLLDQGRL